MKKLLSILLASVMLLGLAAPAFAEDNEQPATDPAAVTDPVDDPTEDPAIDSADVTDPTDDPADVTDPAADPADVTDPADDPADDLSDPTDPADPEDPAVDPEEPSDPEVPEDPNAEIELDEIDDDRNGDGDAPYVAQIGSANYTSLAEAVQNANASDTIVMLANTTLTGTVTIGTTLTLDLNGKEIDGRGLAKVIVVNSGKFTLVDNGAGATGKILGGEDPHSSYNSYTLEVRENGSADLRGGTISATASAKPMRADAVEGNHVELNGATLYVKAYRDSNSYCFYGSNFTMNSGSVIHEEPVGYAVANFGGGKLVINGGTIQSESSALFFGMGKGIEVNGGKISSKRSLFRWWGGSDSYNVLTITGGTFTSETEVFETWRTPSNVSISGGTYSHSVPESFIAEGCIQIENADGTYTITQTQTYALWDESTKTLTLYYGPLPSTYAVKDFESTSDPFSAYSSATKVVIDRSFAKARPTTLKGWFAYFHDLISIEGLNYLNTSNATDMERLFAHCRKITSLDLSTFKTSNVTSMKSMFESCEQLTSLDVSNFDTSQVTDIGFMFLYCYEITVLDLSSFDTRNVEAMYVAFYGCTNLHTIFVNKDKWSTASASVVTSTSMFYDCPALVGGKGTVVGETANVTYARIDEVGNPGYLTDIADKPRLNMGTSETQKQFYVDEIVTQPDGVVYAKLPKNNYPRFSTTNYPILLDPQYQNYIFAGYFKNIGSGATAERTATETTGYARFIPIEVLDVYVQFRHTSLAESDPENKTDLRFLTSVPDPATLGYNGQIVGFRLMNVTNGTLISNAAFGAEYCYDEIIGDYKVQTGSGLVSLTPDKFYSGVSKKVALQTVIGMPNSYFENQKRLSVQPYIITLDGTKSYATVHPFMLKIVNGKKTAAPIANN